MDSFLHQIAERGIDQSLACDPRLPNKGCAFDRQRKVRFAAPIVPGMAAVMVAFVDQRHGGGIKRRVEPGQHFGRDGSSGRIGRSWGHRSYIDRLGQRR